MRKIRPSEKVPRMFEILEPTIFLIVGKGQFYNIQVITKASSSYSTLAVNRLIIALGILVRLAIIVV